MAAGTFMSAETDSSYEYTASENCNLDKANGNIINLYPRFTQQRVVAGAVHPTTGEYSYFMTATYPWLPIYYYGSEGSASLCDAA